MIYSLVQIEAQGAKVLASDKEIMTGYSLLDFTVLCR